MPGTTWICISLFSSATWVALALPLRFLGTAQPPQRRACVAAAVVLCLGLSRKGLREDLGLAGLDWCILSCFLEQNKEASVPALGGPLISQCQGLGNH